MKSEGCRYRCTLLICPFREGTLWHLIVVLKRTGHIYEPFSNNVVILVWSPHAAVL